MKHTKEPWRVDSKVEILSQENNVSWVEGAKTSCKEDEANAARIVACVNAMEGIENPEELRIQRDELIKSLKLCSAVLAGESTTKSELITALESARDILAKIKGAT